AIATARYHDSDASPGQSRTPSARRAANGAHHLLPKSFQRAEKPDGECKAKAINAPAQISVDGLVAIRRTRSHVFWGMSALPNKNFRLSSTIKTIIRTDAAACRRRYFSRNGQNR